MTPTIVTALILTTLLMTVGIATGEITRFADPVEGGNVIEYWRLTHNPAIRDYANYHNTNCWSPDGRYVCYTHYDVPNVGGPDGWPIFVMDLSTGEPVDVGWGASPRWAKQHNWLFYSRPTQDGGNPWEKGVEVWRCDVVSGESDLITWGWEMLGSTDSEDRWIYGNFRRRDLEGKIFHIGRAPIAPESEPELLYDENSAVRPLCNPEHDMLSTRSKQKGPFNPSRLWMALDGSNVHTGVPMLQGGHMSWSGDGEYQLVGNEQAQGRKWDEPFPSNMHLLANCHFGDISSCGRSGRWICGDYRVADLRCGDGTNLPRPPSVLCYPKTVGDSSGPYDADPKGSPDGTKISFVSNYPFATAPATRMTETYREGDSLPVENTEGFPASGELNVLGIVIGYESKTPTSFEGIEFGKYNTDRYSFAKEGWWVTDFSQRLLDEEQREQAIDPWPWLVKAVEEGGFGDDCPLLYQRMTDVYVSVIRLPDPPHLRQVDGAVELIPGENHRETFGYHLSRDGERITEEPVRPGETVELTPGAWEAQAVEWSGLEGKMSLPLQIETAVTIRVLEETPGDFSWTIDGWRVDGSLVSEEDAMAADAALREVHHIHDGMIRHERYEGGALTYAEDLNPDGVATRRCTYEDGALRMREYWTADNQRKSREIFAADGSITERIQWRHDRRPDEESDHWWYEDGMPVREERKGKIWKKQGDEWVQADE